jgi:hypothetical protein
MKRKARPGWSERDCLLYRGTTGHPRY